MRISDWSSDVCSSDLDPMIAKLITWGVDRETAIDAQIEALDSFVLDGIGHNIDFLSALMQHPRFREGRLTTGFIAEEYPEGFTGAPADEELRHKLPALGALIATPEAPRARNIARPPGPPPAPPPPWTPPIHRPESKAP